MEAKLLRIVYTTFLGLIIALFIGLGISTFFPSPETPEYPVSPVSEPTDAQIEKYNKDYDVYTDQLQSYHQVVSIISLVAAVLLLAVSLVTDRRNSTISNGLMLGGLFTLVYSIGRGIASEDNRYTFVAVTVALLVVLYLGYRQFGPNQLAKKKNKSKR